MKDTDVLELFKLYSSDRFESLKLHNDTSAKYLTLVASLLGVTLVGLSQLHLFRGFELLLLGGPILCIAACVQGKQACKRYYKASLLRITILAKLEFLLGLHTPIDWTVVGSDARKDVRPFSEDKYILPDEWVETTKDSTGRDFVKVHLERGQSLLATRTFDTLIVVSAVFVIAIVLKLCLAYLLCLIRQPSICPS